MQGKQRTKKANREAITEGLDAMRNRPDLAAEYEALLITPFGPVPSYAMEDSSSDWWASEEAESLKAELSELLS